MRRRSLAALAAGVVSTGAIFTALPGSAETVTVTKYAVADATVVRGLPWLNIGGLAVGAAGYGDTARHFVRFGSLSSEPVTSVKLKVRRLIGDATSVRVRPVQRLWEEPAINWDTANSLTIGSTSTQAVLRGDWFEADVTSLVAGGAANFVIDVAGSGSTGAWIATREDQSNIPRLEVTVQTGTSTTRPTTTSTTTTVATTPTQATSTTRPPTTTAAPTTTTMPGGGTGAAQNLAMILNSPFRNKLEDSSPYRRTPSSQLPLDVLAPFGQRADYMNGSPDGAEGPFDELEIGAFRVACEFSHFAYDDPIVKPGQPGAAHLHMFWGNTETNAYSTYDSLLNSGAGTCNGGELNRTGYWVPAMIDGKTNRVRVPNRIVVYYKGYGSSEDIKKHEVYPPNMQIVADNSINTKGPLQQDNSAFGCRNIYNGERSNYQDLIPNCVGSSTQYPMVLEMNVKFPQCWNGQDPSNFGANLVPAMYSWFSGICPSTHPRLLPNMEFLIFYPVERGEDTSQWFLSSDVDMSTMNVRADRGGSSHGDWFGAWHQETNRLWIENCTRIGAADCANGWLGGSRVEDNFRSLRLRKQYVPTAASSVPAADLYRALCQHPKTISKPSDVAFCHM